MTSSLSSGWSSAPPTGRAAGPTSCRCGTWFATASCGPGPTPSLKRSETSNVTRRRPIQIEDGERYDELRGVMIEADTVVHRDTDRVAAVGAEILARHGADDAGPGFKEAIRAQATKRVALQFRAVRITSWDHRKLGGVY